MTYFEFLQKQKESCERNIRKIQGVGDFYVNAAAGFATKMKNISVEEAEKQI